jgi:type VI secretion system FHA domain protein
MPQSGTKQPGMTHSGLMQSGMSQSGVTHPGLMQPGMPQSSATQAGPMQPGMSQSGVAQSGAMHPGVTQPGLAQPGATRVFASDSASATIDPAQATHLAQFASQSAGSPALSLDDPATMNAIVRNIVAGLIDVLRARADFRNEFRLPVTRVRMAENNPLKFAINADDALDSLMSRRNPGFMPAAEAFDDAFEDIRFHQLAMLAGMRAGFECVMNRFDPQKLQERFDRQLKHGGFLAVAAKMRYWDLYADWFEELAGDADGAFQRLFGEEFASAYEKQLETLKRNRGGPRH